MCATPVGWIPEKTRSRFGACVLADAAGFVFALVEVDALM
jgi:hypothetical protein